jgi:hypothetical protein
MTMPTIANIGGVEGRGLFGFGGGFGPSTISDVGGIFSDFAKASALRTKGAGERLEAQQYTLAAGLADLNEKYTEESTAIKGFQNQRKAYLTIGEAKADIASNNFQEAGSALDILRDSETQAALTTSVIQQQGLIEEKSYQEQAASYRIMADATNMAAAADDKAAKGVQMDAWFKGAAAIATLI